MTKVIVKASFTTRKRWETAKYTMKASFLTPKAIKKTMVS